jgi:hypothetical protein
MSAVMDRLSIKDRRIAEIDRPAGPAAPDPHPRILLMASHHYQPGTLSVNAQTSIDTTHELPHAART